MLLLLLLLLLGAFFLFHFDNDPSIRNHSIASLILYCFFPLLVSLFVVVVCVIEIVTQMNKEQFSKKKGRGFNKSWNFSHAVLDMRA